MSERNGRFTDLIQIGNQQRQRQFAANGLRHRAPPASARSSEAAKQILAAIVSLIKQRSHECAQLRANRFINRE